VSDTPCIAQVQEFQQVYCQLRWVGGYNSLSNSYQYNGTMVIVVGHYRSTVSSKKVPAGGGVVGYSPNLSGIREINVNVCKTIRCALARAVFT
jgi:hypothetical protein